MAGVPAAFFIGPALPGSPEDLLQRAHVGSLHEAAADRRRRGRNDGIAGQNLARGLSHGSFSLFP